MLKYGGGGHKKVGTCQFTDENMDEMLPKMLDELVNGVKQTIYRRNFEPNRREIFGSFFCCHLKEKRWTKPCLKPFLVNHKESDFSFSNQRVFTEFSQNDTLVYIC